MSRRGRPAVHGHRTRTGRLSRRQGARDDGATNVHRQPHRRPFAALLGEHAAGDARAASALGRLALIGEAEARGKVGRMTGPEHARRVLFGGNPDAPEGPFGISARQYDAGVKLLEAVGRERWVREAPKDKPSAVAFMTARGIDCSVRALSDAQAARYVVAFDDARAALAAAHWPPDAQRVLRIARDALRTMGRGELAGALRLLAGLAVMINPVASAEIVGAVNRLVVDDRDPPYRELGAIRRGLDALAEHFFGEVKGRRPGGAWQDERVGWRGFDGVHAVRTAAKADRDHPYR